MELITDHIFVSFIPDHQTSMTKVILLCNPKATLVSNSKFQISKAVSATKIYSTQLTKSDTYTSESQSNKPCNLKQVQNRLRNVRDIRKKSEDTGEK